MKNKFKTILLIAGLLFLLFTVSSLFILNFNFGIIIFLGFSCILILYGLFYDKLIRLKWLTAGVFTIFSATILFVLFLCLYGKSDNTTFHEDAVIVLGAAVRGEQVSRILASRLDKAVEYHQNNPDAFIVVSGGQGFQENISEADAMERYLISKGVPKDKIIKETEASSTYENLLFSKEILDETFGKPYETVVITSDFHIFRATQFAQKLGYRITHAHAKTDWYSLPMNVCRECLAVVKMWILGQ